MTDTKLLGFLIERENDRKALRLPLEARPNERLRFSAHFWCSDARRHVLKVLAHRPDDSVWTLAVLSDACPDAPGVLVMRGSLEPLVAAGWHRLHIELDDVLVGPSMPIFVVGPRAERPSRYLGRDEPPPKGDEAGSSDPSSPPLEVGPRSRRR